MPTSVSRTRSQKGWNSRERMPTPCIEAASTPIPRVETRSEEHTSELQSLMRISYADFCLKKKKPIITSHPKNRYIYRYATQKTTQLTTRQHRHYSIYIQRN